MIFYRLNFNFDSKDLYNLSILAKINNQVSSISQNAITNVVVNYQ